MIKCEGGKLELQESTLLEVPHSRSRFLEIKLRFSVQLKEHTRFRYLKYS